MSNRQFATVSVLGLLLLTVNACSPAARQRAGAIVGAAAAGAAGASGAQSQPTKLMIFGGPDHKTYLGCLNCNEYATDSIFNSYGTYGSPYSTQSIWNAYSDFGSPYSQHSVCNPYASDPPVIVDHNGAYYGRLTLNQYHPQRGAGANYYDWLNSKICRND